MALEGHWQSNCDFSVPSTVSAMQLQLSKICNQNNVSITNCLFEEKLILANHELILNTLVSCYPTFCCFENNNKKIWLKIQPLKNEWFHKSVGNDRDNNRGYNYMKCYYLGLLRCVYQVYVMFIWLLWSAFSILKFKKNPNTSSICVVMMSWPWLCGWLGYVLQRWAETRPHTKNQNR